MIGALGGGKLQQSLSTSATQVTKPDRHSIDSQVAVISNSIASRLIESSCYQNVDNKTGREVNTEIKNLRESGKIAHGLLTRFLIDEEIIAAVKFLKCGKAQSPDKIAPELFIQNAEMVKEFLLPLHVQPILYLEG